MPTAELSIQTPDGISLSGEESGAGTPVVLLHGLTATRRYVVMGSTELQRSGHRVVAYDARGHGRSDPAPAPDAYTYRHLAADLIAVLDALQIQRALIAGASMGAHTALALALSHPERVAALALVTPAYDPATASDPRALAVALARWDRLARGLREGGVEGFVAAYDLASRPDSSRQTVERVLRQRLAAHAHPEAVADALEAVPRSRPFERLEDLGRIAVPTVVVASRDELDPEHPLAVGERYAQAILGARLIVEDAPPPLRSPIAWQGGRLSRVIGEVTAQTEW
jgi:pimeloyl-ACP methyl ester carboxylesterase